MNRANKVLGAVTVAMEMRSVFLAVFGETLIGHNDKCGALGMDTGV